MSYMTGQEAATFIDRTCIVLMIIVPIWAVIRFRVFGIIAGALIMWMSGLSGIWLISILDPSGNTLAGAIWFLFGWIACLGYSALLSALLYIVELVQSLPFFKKQRIEYAGNQILTTPPPVPIPWYRNFPRLHSLERILMAVAIGFFFFLIVATFVVR